MMLNIEEDMDIDEVEEIRKIREIYGKDGIMSDIELPKEYNCVVNCNQELKKNIHVVVDTNIFLNGAHFIKDIFQSSEYDKFNLVVPWAVIQEIDHFKNIRNTKIQKLHTLVVEATKSVKMFHTWLQNKKSNIFFQTSAQSNECIPEIKVESNDDKILQCCIQISKILMHNSSIILLTEDAHLRNKAMILQINVFNKKEFIDYYTYEKKADALQQKQLCQTTLDITEITNSEHNSDVANQFNKEKLNENMLNNNIYGPSPNKKARFDLDINANILFSEDCLTAKMEHSTSEIDDIQNVKCKIKKALEELICSELGQFLTWELQNQFKNLWEHVVFIKPPWTHMDVIKCFKKHWISVFSNMWQRKYIVNFENLLIIFKRDQSSEIQILTNLEELISNLVIDLNDPNSKKYLKWKNRMQNKLQFIRSKMKKHNIISKNSKNASLIKTLSVKKLNYNVILPEQESPQIVQNLLTIDFTKNLLDDTYIAQTTDNSFQLIDASKNTNIDESMELIGNNCKDNATSIKDDITNYLDIIWNNIIQDGNNMIKSLENQEKECNHEFIYYFCFSINQLIVSALNFVQKKILSDNELKTFCNYLSTFHFKYTNKLFGNPTNEQIRIYFENENNLNRLHGGVLILKQLIAPIVPFISH